MLILQYSAVRPSQRSVRYGKGCAWARILQPTFHGWTRLTGDYVIPQDMRIRLLGGVTRLTRSPNTASRERCRWAVPRAPKHLRRPGPTLTSGFGSPATRCVLCKTTTASQPRHRRNSTGGRSLGGNNCFVQLLSSDAPPITHLTLLTPTGRHINNLACGRR